MTDLDPEDEVYIGTNCNYRYRYHKNPDCRMLRQNNAEYRTRTVRQVEPQHSRCQTPDCWGSREDYDDPTCPICGGVFFGAKMPRHITQCDGSEEVVDG